VHGYGIGRRYPFQYAAAVNLRAKLVRFNDGRRSPRQSAIAVVAAVELHVARLHGLREAYVERSVGEGREGPVVDLIFFSFLMGEYYS